MADLGLEASFLPLSAGFLAGAGFAAGFCVVFAAGFADLEAVDFFSTLPSFVFSLPLPEAVGFFFSSAFPEMHTGHVLWRYPHGTDST